jgi:tetratricopeptide (TPR) repeat protein/tRNA A-37 threonylcarbamoyl transferase component Bud32
MLQQQHDPNHRETPLDKAIAEYYDVVGAGHSIERGEFLGRYPDLAADLAEFFAAEDRMQLATAPLRPGGFSTPVPGCQCDDTPDLNAGPLTLGDYELLEILGQGGMGVVYKARQKSLNRVVALKLMRGDRVTSPDQLRRFRNEAEAAATLEHRNVVPIYEVGDCASKPFFSMRLMEGGNLATHIKPFLTDPAAGAQLVADVAGAVHYAHQRGILHRDLKPSNILLDADGKPHVADFGLAKWVELDSSLTHTGDLLGTPSYVAPEQALPGPRTLTAATDVYGLGAILYVLLTGRPPFQGETPLDTLDMVRSQEPVAPRQLNKRVPIDLETIALKALEKNPRDRYGTVKAMREDLTRFLRDEPTLARRPSLWQRARKWSRRHKAATRAIAAFFTATALIVAAAGWLLLDQAVRSEAEMALDRDRAVKAETNTQDALAEMQKAKAKMDVALKEAEASRRSAAADIKALFFLEIKDPGKAVAVYAELIEHERANLGPNHPYTLEAMHRIADVYAKNKRVNDAIALGKQIVQINRDERGPDHRSTLIAMANLASYYRQAEEYIQAIALYEEVRAKFNSKDNDGYFNLLRGQINTYVEAKRFSEAIAVYEELLNVQKVKLGPDHDATLQTRKDLGLLYVLNRFHAKAIALYEELLPIVVAKFGPGHQTAVAAAALLPGEYWATGQLNKYVAISEATFEVRRKILGADHALTFVAMHGLAFAYSNVGCHDDAIDMLNEVIKAKGAKFGEDNIQTLNDMAHLGVLYRVAGRLKEAIEQHEATLQLRKAKLGADNVTNTMTTLAAIYREAGDLDKSFALYKEALKAIEGKFGADHITTLYAMQGMALTLVLQKKAAEAEPILRRSQELEEQKAGDDVRTYAGRNALGLCLTRLGRFAEAEPLLLNGYESLEKETSVHWATDRRLAMADAVNWTVELYDSWGKQEKADEWRQKKKAAGK